MKKPDLNNKTYVPYGPATGKSDSGRNPKDFIDESPYSGNRGPDGKVDSRHVPGGPGHKGCNSD